jgi:hypothetical protein
VASFYSREEFLSGEKLLSRMCLVVRKALTEKEALVEIYVFAPWSLYTLKCLDKQIAYNFRSFSYYVQAKYMYLGIEHISNIKH